LNTYPVNVYIDVENQEISIIVKPQKKKGYKWLMFHIYEIQGLFFSAASAATLTKPSFKG
jgi:hypothetical protein